MYSANGFNVCPHCGKANSLNARFCACCGKQLTVPDEVVVCPKCHKTNSPMASFCGQCGAPLKEGMPTKICPRCGKAVSISDNVCVCGYNFGTAFSESGGAAVKTRHSYRGGRAVAIVALIFLLAFVYFIVMPVCALRPQSFGALDGGILCEVGSDGAKNYKYGWDILTGDFILQITNPSRTGDSIVTCICLLTMLCMTVHLIVCIVRIFTAKRSKHGNVLYLVLAIVTTLWIILWATCKYLIPADSADWLLAVRNAFVPVRQTGCVMFAFPVYFWFFYVYSACFKVHTVREKMIWRAN